MVSINGNKTNGFLSTHLPISSWSNTASKRIDSSSCKLSVPVVVSSSARNPQNTLHKLSNLPEYINSCLAPPIVDGWTSQSCNSKSWMCPGSQPNSAASSSIRTVWCCLPSALDDASFSSSALTTEAMTAGKCCSVFISSFVPVPLARWLFAHVG